MIKKMSVDDSNWALRTDVCKKINEIIDELNKTHDTYKKPLNKFNIEDEVYVVFLLNPGVEIRKERISEICIGLEITYKLLGYSINQEFTEDRIFSVECFEKLIKKGEKLKIL